MQVGIIGTSHWHMARYGAALQAAGARIVAACDPWSSVAAHQALPEATAHDTVAALLCHPALDLVVALPRPRHGADVVRAIIESGLPAIVEKPVACDAAALAPLAEAAQMRHSWLTVPFVARYSPLWSALGTADDLLSAHLRIVNGPPQRYAAAGCGWMLDPAESGGGALRNLGIHAADIAVQLGGGRSWRVHAAQISSRAHHTAVDDDAIALLERDDGARLVIEAGYTVPVMAAGMTRGGDTCWRVTTRRHLISDDEATLHVIGDGRDTARTAPTSAQRYARCVEDALRRLDSGQPPIADLADAWAAARLVDAIYAAARR